MDPNQQPAPAPEPTQILTPTTPPPVTAVPQAAQYTAPTAAPVGTVKKGLAIAALVLSIVGMVLGLFWFIAAPLAITAIILAIVSLVKKRGGKGMSIASLVIGGVTIFIVVPFFFITSLVAYNALTERANQTRTQSQLFE